MTREVSFILILSLSKDEEDSHGREAADASTGSA